MIRKTRFFFTISCFVFIMFMANANHSLAKYPPVMNKEIPIYLKIGQYYILYTEPSPPFLDQHGRLLIPLRSIEELMGGHVSYHHQTKKAAVELLNHSFILEIGNNIATVDDREIQMDTIPVLKDGAMFLPLRLFLNHTDIEYEWSNELRLLHIKDERLIVGKPFQQFAGNDFTEGHTDGAFHLLSYTLKKSSQGTTGIKIKAKNLTKEKIPKGKTDIQPLIHFKDGGFSIDSYTRPINPSVPEIQKNSLFTVSKTIGLYDASYIISVARKAP